VATRIEIDLALCRRRQARLLERIEPLRLDAVIVTRLENVQWLAGPRFLWYFEPSFLLRADGRATLVAPSSPPGVAAADDIRTYKAKSLSTLRSDQRQRSVAELHRAMKELATPRRIGIEYSHCPPHMTTMVDAELVDVDAEIRALRRRKDPDELARIHRAIAATGAMYKRAREIIEPGINELNVFSQLQAAAVTELGEMLTGTGNDYACGERGGPPRDRLAQDGELYILDLGPAYQGYFADNCRTFAVNRHPTDEQHATWEQIAAVFPLVESTVKPGVSCRKLFEDVKAQLDDYMPGSFRHHLGHGIGLFPHEIPYVNPNWDDRFEEGDVFTIEPGLYAPQLRAGIRLENDYLVTSTGVELLSDFPLEL